MTKSPPYRTQSGNQAWLVTQPDQTGKPIVDAIEWLNPPSPDDRVELAAFLLHLAEKLVLKEKHRKAIGERHDV